MSPIGRRVTCLVVAVLLSLTASGCDKFEALRGEKVARGDVPPTVAATIDAESKGAAVKEIMKLTENGKPVYIATIEANGKETRTEIAEDGHVIKRGEDDDADD